MGNGLLYSLNYDIQLKKGVKDGLGVRTGYGLLSIGVVDTNLNVTGKAILNILYEARSLLKHKIEQLYYNEAENERYS